MTIRIFDTLDQGSDEWLAARRGMLTASEAHNIVTPTGNVAANDKLRAHVWEIAAQRISGHTEPSYVSDDMLRGWEDEIAARALYADNYAPVREVGFVVNGALGFEIGCSPDGLIGDDGMIEIKSRAQRFQVQTIMTGEVPPQYMPQIQFGLLVTGRKWCDYVSYCAGLPMVAIRVLPDDRWQEQLRKAAADFEAAVKRVIADYRMWLGRLRHVQTERKIEQEIGI
jgi:hypothetical protein